MEVFGVTLGIGLIIAAFFANLIFSSVILFVVVNFLVSGPEKEPFSRCILGAFYLVAVMFVAGLALVFIPIPLLNLVTGIGIWLWGSKLVLEAAFDRMEGGCTILFYYYLCIILINFLLGFLFGTPS